MTKIKNSLPLQIFIALGLGIAAGFIFIAIGHPEWPTRYIAFIGTIFLNLLKFIVVPIVLTSIISGIVSLSDIKQVGSIGLKTVIYYMVTTMFAITLGLIFANLAKPLYPVLSTSDAVYEAAEKTSFIDTIINIFPSNIIDPLLNSTMLQIICIAIFIGFAILCTGEKGEMVLRLNEALYEVFMVIMNGIIKMTPVAVFCLITPVVAENGPKVLGSLAAVLGTAYLCYLVQAVVIDAGTVKLLSGISMGTFLKKSLPSFMFAFSSTSSIATIPISMECVEDMGGRRDVASFTLPLGATINMNGTAIYQGVCAIFIASCYGIDLTIPQMITIVITATLAAVGTAGTPGAGLIMLSMVLQSVGLPVEGIALVAGVDRIFDMGRTGLNVLGDLAAAVIVSKREDDRDAKLGIKGSGFGKNADSDQKEMTD